MATLTAEAQIPLSTPAYQLATPINVGGTAAGGTATVTITVAGTVSEIRVLTQGLAGKDFSGTTGGSCTVGSTYSVNQTCTVAVSFQPLYPGLRQGAVVLRDSGNAVLGTELLKATGVGATAVFVPAIIEWVAGDEQWIYRGDGGKATGSSLYEPMGGAADAAGNLYLSDKGNDRVRFVSAATGNISTLVGDGIAGFAGDGGPAANAQLFAPSDVKLDGAGNFYIADSKNHAIRMVTSTGIIRTIAGVGGVLGYSGDGGPATQAHLTYPSAIAFDGNVALYISDTGNNVIRKVDLSTGTISTVAGTGTAGYSGDGGPATLRELNYPWGIALGDDGSLYIADQQNNRIRRVDPAGSITTVVGTGSRSYGGDGGLATAAELNVPAAVLLDVAGNLYVADSGNQLVRKVSATTGVIERIAGQQGGGLAINGYPATWSSSGFNGPYALWLDGPGNLYIANMFDQLIEMVRANLAGLYYPDMKVGRVSSPLMAKIEDDGNAGLTFSAFNEVSNSQLDSESTTCVLGQIIAVDQSCVLGVDFAPTITGLVTGSLSAVSNAVNGPNVVGLLGTVLPVLPTQATLTSDTNPAALGKPITFTVVVSNGDSVAATGTVNFFDGTGPIGSMKLDPTGMAKFPISTLSTGTHSITAVYVPDIYNAAATSNAVSQGVQQQTTTVLASPVNPAVAATSVTFTATVAGPVGTTTTPSGKVTFSDNPTTIGTATLVGGVATLTTTTLTGGQHLITANYVGDTFSLPSQSVVLTQSMWKQATTTALTLTTSDPSVFPGVSVTFTSVVARVDNAITPTGTVTFLDGGTAIGTGTLDGSGKATLSTPLGGGVHSITAMYGGDASASGSTSTGVTETVQQIATVTTEAVGANPEFAGAALHLTATVVQSGSIGKGGPFSGTVTFLDGLTPVGTATVSAAGVAPLDTTTLALGSHSITASFGGSANYLSSASPPIAETINLATTTTALGSRVAQSIAGGPVTLMATVSGNGGVATGLVTFMDGGTPLGSGALNTQGAVTFVTSTLAVGSHTLTAVYSGDAKDSGSTSNVATQVVSIATSTTTLASSMSTSPFGGSVTFTASVTTDGGAATGTVTFSDGASVLGTVALIAGKAACSTATLALGVHSITAAYSGDANNKASQSMLNEQVQQAGPVTLTSTPNPSIAGISISFTATIAAPQGAAVTGSVTFRDNGMVLNQAAAPVSGGQAVYSTAALAVGQHWMVAVYGGDGNNQAATSGVLVQTVQIAGTSVKLTPSVNPSLASAAVTLTATVVGTGGSVTGSVTFEDGTTQLGSAKVNAGVATFAASRLTPGPHSIIAIYGGDADNVPSTSPILTQTVMQATTVALSSSQKAALAMDAVTFTAKVANNGSTPATGTVAFSDGTAVLGIGTLSAGTATLTTAALAVGQNAITAAYSGDAVDLAGTSAALSQSVQLRPTSNTLTASSTSLTGGQQVTLISVVRYAGPVTPTGTVTLTLVSNGTLLGIGVVDNAGVATLTVNMLTSAPSVKASYSGDSVYAASSSPQTSITVAKPTQFSMQLSPAEVTLVSRQHSSTTLTITSVNGFTDTLDLGCLGLPFAATCTFTNDAVPVAANGTRVIQVVVDTGSPLTAGSVARLEQQRKESVAVCMLPGGVLFGLMFSKRRRRMRSGLTGLLILALLVGVSAGLSGCSGMHVNGTPPGTYVFQVTATGTGSGVTQAIDITLTVTQ